MKIMKKKLLQIMKKWNRRKILVIGDVGVDRYTEGAVERISPEAPVPILAVVEQRCKLGLAANVADNIRVLGGTPWMTGVIGRDEGGRVLRQLLKDQGIADSDLLEDKSRPTILKERFVAERQQLLRVDYEQIAPLELKGEAALLRRIEKRIPLADAVIVEDYAKGLLTDSFLQTVFRTARIEKKLTLVDPNLKTKATHYIGADLLTPNRKEAESLAEIKIESDASLKRCAEIILEKTQGSHVVITLGKDGMALLSKGEQKVWRIPTFAREVYDVSGAGDTVIAVLSLALASGSDLFEAATLANLAAGIEVGKWGTATVTVKEITDFLNAIA